MTLVNITSSLLHPPGLLIEVDGHIGIDSNGDGSIDVDLGLVIGDGTGTGTSTGGNGTSTGGNSSGGSGTSTGGSGTPSSGGSNGGTLTPGGTIQVFQGPDGDAIVGTNGNDFLLGGPGNDHLFGAGGNDIIDGAGGFDESIYQGNFGDYVITGSGNVEITDGVNGRDGSDTVRNVEVLTFKDGVYDTRVSVFLTNQDLIDTATAYRAVNRVDGSLSIVESAALSIANHQQTLDGYIDGLVQGASHGSVPALIVSSFVIGLTPTSEKLDSLTAFASQQYDFYANTLHSAFAQLGPYEAIGRGLSETSQFESRYAGGTDSSFVVHAYGDVLGRMPTAAQVQHYVSQLTLFEGMYASAGIATASADVQARGAVLGQMLGSALTDPAEIATHSYDEGAHAFFSAAAHGDTTVYGQPWSIFG